jgi:hypothetical protein
VRTDALDQRLFVRAADGAFYLVDDPDGGLCVVPAHAQVTTQFLQTYYGSSYDYGGQSSGELYLLRPAEVTARDDHWRLENRGRLEVRVS